MEHAERIRAAIAEAVTDRFEVWIRNDCCGCSRMDLVISAPGVEDKDAPVISLDAEDDDLFA